MKHDILVLTLFGGGQQWKAARVDLNNPNEPKDCTDEFEVQELVFTEDGGEPRIGVFFGRPMTEDERIQWAQQQAEIDKEASDGKEVLRGERGGDLEAGAGSRDVGSAVQGDAVQGDAGDRGPDGEHSGSTANGDGARVHGLDGELRRQPGG